MPMIIAGRGFPPHPAMPPSPAMDPQSPLPADAASAASSAAPAVNGASRSFSTAQFLGALFIVAQVIFVAVNHFPADSPRLLTPVGGLTHYEIHATRDEEALGSQEIRERYGVPARGDSALTAQALQSVIRHWERAIPLSRAVYVRVRTREAGGAEEFWLWPQN